jgi:hypothetical protein
MQKRTRQPPQAADDRSKSRIAETNGPRRQERQAPAAPGVARLVSTLKSLALFAGLPQADLARLAKLMRPRHVSEGGIVFSQGDPAREFFVLVAGRVIVTIKGGDPEGPPIAILGGPTWFGDRE